MSGITVRPAIIADIPAIAAIYGHAVLTGTASFELVAPDNEEMAQRFTAVTGAGFPYLAAIDDATGALLGYAYISAYRTRPAYGNSVENSVYVSDKAKRRGVGRLLLAALLERATALGFRQMIAVIGDSANMPSIGLHRALGFTFCGTIHSVGYKHGRWLDSVIMQLPLGEGDRAPPRPDRMPRP
ncbi:MAG TPA: N-acetyltransferase family protein [Hyphomicrobiaceae bacterium]|nr:N-acetyltransferase family protein [Hyphomicrobiaceae bacterium]